MDNTFPIQHEFNALIVEYINTFNFIETNVGLCISCIEKESTDLVYKKLAKTSFDKKLAYLLKLVKSNERDLEECCVHEFESWCNGLKSERNQRNRFVHGNWKLFPHLEHGVELNIPPWYTQKYSDSHKNRFSFAELEEIVRNIKETFNQFNSIRRKCGV